MSDDPIKIVAKLRRTSGELIECACEFEASEWRILQRFAELADRLTRTKLLASPSGLEFSLSVDANGVTTFTPTQVPTDDDFSALLHHIRPFVLKSEPTFFLTIRNILSHRLDHPVFRAYLNRQKDIYDGVRYRDFAFVAAGDLLNSSEMLERWLNGYEYHHEERKRAYFEALQIEATVWKFTTATYVTMMLDRANVVIEIKNAIRVLGAGVPVTPIGRDSFVI